MYSINDKERLHHALSEMFTCRAFRIDLLILLSEIVIVGLDLNKICQYGYKREKGRLRNLKRKYIEHYFMLYRYTTYTLLSKHNYYLVNNKIINLYAAA